MITIIDTIRKLFPTSIFPYMVSTKYRRRCPACLWLKYNTPKGDGTGQADATRFALQNKADRAFKAYIASGKIPQELRALGIVKMLQGKELEAAEAAMLSGEIHGDYTIAGRPDAIGVNRRGQYVIIDGKSFSQNRMPSVSSQYRFQMGSYILSLRAGGYDVSDDAILLYYSFSMSNFRRIVFRAVIVPLDAVKYSEIRNVYQEAFGIITGVRPINTPACPECRSRLSMSELVAMIKA